VIDECAFAFKERFFLSIDFSPNSLQSNHGSSFSRSLLKLGFDFRNDELEKLLMGE
jgi:hypothetical protein